MTDDEALAGYKTHSVERFFRFHRNNPHVFGRLKEIAREMRAAGWKRYGIRRIMEVMRWERERKTRGEVFKINCNFIPMYARLLIARYPVEFTGFFELRRIRSLGRFSDEERFRRAAIGMNTNEEDSDL